MSSKIPLRARILEPHTFRHRIFLSILSLNVWMILSDGTLLSLSALVLFNRTKDALSANGGFPWHVTALMVAYVLVRVAHIFYRSLNRSRLRKVREDKIREFLSAIHERLFGRFPGVRYTLFQPDPTSPFWLRAQARYEHGREHDRASTSRARYLRDMGHTGAAWGRLPTARGERGIFVKFPEFADRKALEDYYQNLGIPTRIVKKVSTYMEDVCALYSIRLIGGDGITDHGVLSIDVNKHVAGELNRTEGWPTAPKLADAVTEEILAYLELEVETR